LIDRLIVALLVAYYPAGQPLEQADLDDLLATLNHYP
jgi:hypothetical protein